jgi:adenosylhomocysteine nucleosidase
VTILAATGLRRERRLIEGPGIEVIAGGGDVVRLEAELDRLAGKARGIISIGIAGALAFGLTPGRWIVARAVLDNGKSIATDPAWTSRLVARLPHAAPGLLIGTNSVVAEAAQKAGLHQATGADAVDMESHIVARVAGRHRLPFVAARVISDAAGRTLPPAARVGMRPDGAMDLPAVWHSLLREPFQLPALIWTGLEAEWSFRSLFRGCHRLGPGLGGP